MIPAAPSGENCAEGLVITSTRSIWLAGNACKAWAALAPRNNGGGLAVDQDRHVGVAA